MMVRAFFMGVYLCWDYGISIEIDTGWGARVPCPFPDLPLTQSANSYAVLPFSAPFTARTLGRSDLPVYKTRFP
jgi:hypothetical protein